jgi:Mn-dependent DtxR family transcriptional regulator
MAMLEHDAFLTTTQIANLANISWNTADKYLKQMGKEKWIEHTKRGNRDLWKANPPE